MTKNRIVIPANFTFEVIIRVDPMNGQSELLIRNRSNVQVTMYQVVGLLIEHASTVLKSLLTGKVVKQTPIEIEVELDESKKANGGENAT